MTGTGNGSQQAEPAQQEGSFAYCAWHQGHSRSARLVQLADQGSGPGAPGLHACASCREAYGLIPLADKPL